MELSVCQFQDPQSTLLGQLFILPGDYLAQIVLQFSNEAENIMHPPGTNL